MQARQRQHGEAVAKNGPRRLLAMVCVATVLVGGSFPRVASGAGGVAGHAMALSAASPSATLLHRIAALERARTPHPDAIVRALRDPAGAVRQRAVVALGRLRDSTAIGALEPLAHDPLVAVRAELAFSLGQIGAVAGGPTLARLAHDPAADVRLEAAEGLGKLARRVPIDPLLTLLHDRVLAVRGQAALGLARRGDSLAVVPLLAASRDDDSSVRWKATYALEKIVWPDSVLPAMHARIADPDPLVRAYAARTLGRQRDSRAGDDLESLVFDRDPRVVINAVRSLAQVRDSALVQLVGPRPFLDVSPSADPESLAMVFLFRMPDDWRTQTLVATAQSLGQLGDRAAVPLLVRGLRASSPQVRSSCAAALAAILKDGALPHIGPLYWDPSSQVRNKVVDLCGDFTSDESWESLAHAWTKPNGGRMQFFAAGAMERRHDPRAVALVRPALTSSDVQLAAQVATTLAAAGGVDAAFDVAALYERHAAIAGGDARLAAVQAFATLADTAATRDAAARSMVRTAWQSIATAAWTDPDLRVRAQADSTSAHIEGVAATASARASAGRVAPRRATAEPGRRRIPAGVAYESAGPMTATIHTSRGDIGVELFPRDAPQTVANWVTLARSGYFTGIVFHRVVPNFVIQGGDPDSTGSGGPGYSIPDEFNRHRYGPGAVGMALSGPDTGGSQWFITHSPQPHLDGHYTIFAQVTAGMDVVDRVEEGDGITGIDVRGGPGAARAAAGAAGRRRRHR